MKTRIFSLPIRLLRMSLLVMGIVLLGYATEASAQSYTTLSGQYADYTFNSGATYYISAPAEFSGTVIFNPGCVIKFASNAYLLLYGPITCNGSGSNPSIFTDMNDNVFGVTILGSSGNPTYSAQVAVWLYYDPSPITLNGLKIRWAQTAIRIDSNVPTQSNTIENCSIEFSQTGVYLWNSTAALQSSTKCNVQTPVTGRKSWSYTGSLTDVCTGDSDNNGVNDVVEYQYFGQLGTLQGHVVGQVAQHINGHTPPPATDEAIIVNANVYPYTDPLNSSNWVLNATGRSSFACWNGGQFPNQLGPTLITKRHAVTAAHVLGTFTGSLPFLVRWDDVNGNASYAYVLNGAAIAGTDIAILVLDRDVTNVQPAQLVGTDVSEKLNHAFGGGEDPNPECYLSRRLVCVTCNQFKDAFVYEGWVGFNALVPEGNGNNNYGVAFAHSVWFPSWAAPNSPTWCGGQSDVISGDSGSPCYLLVNNNLLLIGTWSTTYTCPFLGAYINQINSTISNLDATVGYITGYTVSTYSLSAFANFQ